MQVTRPVLIAAAAVFVALLATVFFLLGRETARRRPVVMAAPPPTIAASEPAPVPAAAPPLPVPAAQIAPPPVSAPALPTAGTVAVPVPATAPAAPPVQSPIRMNIQSAPPPTAAVGTSDDASAVRNYFTYMQAIQATAPSTDTNEFANKLLASAMTGDTSGLDELIRVTEEGARRAQAISPPAPCADYHQHMVAMLGESASMVRQLKTALTSKDASALASMSATGASLQSRASALDQQAQQIKSEYGVPR